MFGVPQQYITAAFLGIKHSIDKACILAMVKCCGDEEKADIRSYERHSRSKSVSQKAAEEMIVVGEYFQDIFFLTY